jgi:hypothetical protein
MKPLFLLWIASGAKASIPFKRRSDANRAEYEKFVVFAIVSVLLENRTN